MRLGLLLFALPLAALAQTQTRELVGQLGSRSALLVLNASRKPDGAWQLSGEYLVLPTLQRRYLDGEASPEIGVTTLREGASAILFGHEATGELRGIWRGGIFKGARYAPGGQERERFEFSEEFPPMGGYSANVRCDVADGGYKATLAYAVQGGKLETFDWRSRADPGGEACTITNLHQQARAAAACACPPAAAT
jgi:hypothetical protein